MRPDTLCALESDQITCGSPDLRLCQIERADEFGVSDRQAFAGLQVGTDAALDG